MTEHELDERLRAKYRSRSSEAAPSTLARRVLAIPATSPQRRGWLPWLPHGGTHLMLSATKMVTGVAVIALTGILLTGGIADPPAEQVPPGASSPELDMTSRPVSGTITGVPSTPSSEDVEFTAASQSVPTWRGVRDAVVWESDDARLTGEARYVEHGSQHLQTWTGLRSTAWVLRNDAGTWTGTGPAFDTQAGGSGFVTLTGAGDYEGLVAYIALGPDLDPDAVDAATARNFEGVIFLGEAPVQPELPTP